MTASDVRTLPIADSDHRRLSRRCLRRAAAGLATALVTLPALTGCADELLRHVKTEHFDTFAEAPVDGDLAFVLPSFVPVEATDITVRVDTEQPDSKMYDWRGAAAVLPDDCQPADGPGAPVPFEASAWPRDVSSADGWTCGSRPLQLRQVGERSYAW